MDSGASSWQVPRVGKEGQVASQLGPTARVKNGPLVPKTADPFQKRPTQVRAGVWLPNGMSRPRFSRRFETRSHGLCAFAALAPPVQHNCEIRSFGRRIPRCLMSTLAWHRTSCRIRRPAQQTICVRKVPCQGVGKELSLASKSACMSRQRASGVSRGRETRQKGAHLEEGRKRCKK